MLLVVRVSSRSTTYIRTVKTYVSYNTGLGGEIDTKSGSGLLTQ